MTEDFNPITLEGLNSSSEVHYFNNNVSFFEPVDVFGGLELQSAANVERIFEKVCVYEEAGYDEIKIDLANNPFKNSHIYLKKYFRINRKQIQAVNSSTSLEDLLVEKAAVLV